MGCGNCTLLYSLRVKHPSKAARIDCSPVTTCATRINSCSPLRPTAIATGEVTLDLGRYLGQRA
eukprot:3755040-Rhodomonas_salina.1